MQKEKHGWFRCVSGRFHGDHAEVQAINPYLVPTQSEERLGISTYIHDLSPPCISSTIATDVLSQAFVPAEHLCIPAPLLARLSCRLPRCLKCVLAPSKASVLAKYEQVKTMNLPTDGKEKMLLSATRTPENPQGLTFFNTSQQWII